MSYYYLVYGGFSQGEAAAFAVKQWGYYATSGDDPTPWSEWATAGANPTTWASLET